MVLVLSAVLGFLVFMGPAPAQTYQFNDVRVEGNLRVDPASILRFAGIRRGQEVSAAQLNDAYQRIVGSGLFESVTIEPAGSTLVISVQEFPTINVISFEGNKRLKDDKLAEMIQSQPRRVYSPSQAEADAAVIAAAYEQEGRITAIVDPRIIRRSENRVDLVFEIQEGNVVEVERLNFVGNRNYSDRRLREVLETKQAGLLRTFIPSDTFIADRIDLDKQLLRDFYASRGYVDFEVLDATAELTRERDGFFVTFTVQEGQSFKVGTVNTVSEIEGVDAAEFASVVKLRPGVTYSPSIIQTNVTRMENLALKKGLNFVRIDPRITRNERTLTLDVEFVIVRGERIFVERIDIEGNTTTLDQVIRRQFRTVEGDPFTPSEIRQSAERIRALGFFEEQSIVVETKPGTNPDQVLVNVDVVEAPTGQLSLGASYGASTGVAFTVGFKETNFLGRGQTFGLAISAGSDEANSSLVFIEPSFLGRDLSFNFQAYYNETNYASAYYNTREVGVSPGIEFPFGDNGSLELAYELSEDNMYDVAVGSSIILKNEEALGALTNSILSYTYTYDTRVNGLDPLSGILLSFGQEFSGFGGDTSYIYTFAQAIGERSVWNEEVTLSASLTAGAINMLDGQTSRVTNRFFGNNYIRGFERNGQGPRDLTAVNQDALGGNFLTALQLEADFPLGLPEEYGLSGGVFLDMGSVWGLNDTNGTGGPVDDSFHLRSSIGLSIFWTTPLGPLRFNFAQAIAKQDYDVEQVFDLTVATEF